MGRSCHSCRADRTFFGLSPVDSEFGSEAFDSKLNLRLLTEVAEKKPLFSPSSEIMMVVAIIGF
jgi:hypothetical protein